MNREKAALLERLTVEAAKPTPRKPKPCLPDWTPEEQAEHRQILLDALSKDPVVVAWVERRSA